MFLSELLRVLPSASLYKSVAAVSEAEVQVERVEHGQDRRGDGRGVRLDGGAREGARVAVDARHEKRRVGRGARHNHVVATGGGAIARIVLNRFASTCDVLDIGVTLVSPGLVFVGSLRGLLPKVLACLDCLSELRRGLDHVVDSAELPRYFLRLFLGKNLQKGVCIVHSEFCFLPYSHTRTCLDCFSVDYDLSRRALADLHRPFVKADVGVRKVVFEGVNLSV